jgi:hypothetical protein
MSINSQHYTHDTLGRHGRLLVNSFTQLPLLRLKFTHIQLKFHFYAAQKTPSLGFTNRRLMLYNMVSETVVSVPWLVRHWYATVSINQGVKRTKCEK